MNDGVNRPALLEMGGKNSCIINEDADVALAAMGCSKSAFGLSGQKCSALSRVYVHRSLHDEFLRLEVELDDLLDTCAGNPYLRAALAPLRTHCRRFWYLHQERLPLSEVITGLSSMVRLVARRDCNGALKASDAVISVIERLAGGTRSQAVSV